LGDILREDELVAARQDRDRTGADPRQLGSPGRVFKNIDRLELDPTDREKLLESQAAGSARLPERLQRRGLGHRALLVILRSHLRWSPRRRQPAPPQMSPDRLAGLAGPAPRSPERSR
jgi:hypothetical protein